MDGVSYRNTKDVGLCWADGIWNEWAAGRRGFTVVKRLIAFRLVTVFYEYSYYLKDNFGNLVIFKNPSTP
ncbi:hypothetical protein J7E43_05505 [Bacillus sp. ISL-8]|nr:hypothetical protein [Bacillus sp. ISL-8]